MGANRAVDIRLLGPVEVAGDEAVVPVGGPRLRTLIGLIALRAPAVLSRPALIDGIWDCSPPANAAKTLRAHVAYLRRGFAAAGLGDLIATRAPGYGLAVPADCVDAYRFERRVGLGRTASASGAFEIAADHLRTALRLWRGDVLADCATGEWVRAEATRLDEVRLSATEELVAAELAVGRHTSVVAELEALVARHPLRERLWELLMRAHYRAGRRGDALRAYQRARSTLVEHLGVEPGPELRRLEVAILAGDLCDPTGTATTVTHTEPDPALPMVPAPLTRLIGREADLAELRALLAERRLVCLTGVGGCGKTRLAIALCHDASPRFPDGVLFLDLSSVPDPALLPAAVAAAIGVPEDLSLDPAAALARWLRSRCCLLVLDNCEHLLAACAELVTALLRSCPALTVLATSRETLGVLGEVAWPVPPLAVPPRPPPGELAGVRRYAAVRLFLDRATAAAVRDLTDADAPALAAVCAGLDGLPLAIELAAARTAVLTVADIADRLHDPTLLARGLDAAIGWSYDLLDPIARSRLRRLSVFAGGFPLAAAEAIWDGCHDRPPVDAMADLVAKSLVVMEPRRDPALPSGTRYRLLETVRRWAADRLEEQPAEERQARTRHAAHFLALAEEADRHLRGPDLAEWLTRLEVEHENLRAAMSWLGREDTEPAGELRLAVSLARYCHLRGRYRDGRLWLEGALSRNTEPLPAELFGRGLAAAAVFALLVGDYGEAYAWGRRALKVQRDCGDDAGAAGTLRLLSSVARERGDYPASLAHLDEAMATPRRDGESVAHIRQLAGFTAWLAGDLGRASRLLRDALRRYQRAGDEENVASTRIHLAAVALYRGRLAQAESLADNALTSFTGLDEQEGIAWARNILGLVALRAGRPAEARKALRASLAVHCAVGDRWRQASVLDALAAATVADGDPGRAAELVGLAGSLRAAMGVPVPTVELDDWAGTDAILRRTLSADERAAAAERGGALRVPDVLAG